MMANVYTALATPNIAFVKYWGKRDGKLNLPNNSSISMTLSEEKLNTTTSVAFSAKLTEDVMFINGERQDIASPAAAEKSKFIQDILSLMKERAGMREHALVVSQNSFPTGSGIASSASGAAALSFLLANALKLDMQQKEISVIARRISGSACRSMYGGLVKWQRGELDDGSDSYAFQIADKDHWPELMDIVAIVDPGKKKVSSSEGHALTMKTSELYEARPRTAERHASAIEDAIKRRDFNEMAYNIMKDSNNMHATMLDTWPPIMYLTDVSREIIYSVHELNTAAGENIAAYTFDAGSNAHIITTEKHEKGVMDMLKGMEAVRNIISARQGDGPRMLGDGDALITPEFLRLKGLEI